jgi:hypothetical protein
MKMMYTTCKPAEDHVQDEKKNDAEKNTIAYETEQRISVKDGTSFFALLKKSIQWIFAPMSMAIHVMYIMCSFSSRLFPPLRWFAKCIVYIIRVVICVQFVVLGIYISKSVISIVCIGLCTADDYIQSVTNRNTIGDVMTRAYAIKL